jgi:hypothetical protein
MEWEWTRNEPGMTQENLMKILKFSNSGSFLGFLGILRNPEDSTRNWWGRVKTSSDHRLYGHTHQTVQCAALVYIFHREIVDHDICDPSSSHADQSAWEILQTFTSSEMTLPDAKEHLKKQLGNQYIACDWQPALDVVMNAEGDIFQAQEALQKLASEC